MITLFNSGWQFAEKKIESGLKKNDGTVLNLKADDFLGDRTALSYEPVHIPHDWMISDTNGLYRDSVGFYTKKFNLSGVDGRHIALRFEGVYTNSGVFVNGKSAGVCHYGYSTFEYDVTDLVKEGENTVDVIAVYQSPNTRWYSGAGIFRDVWLIDTPESFLVSDGTYVRTAPVNKDCLFGEWKLCVSAELALCADEKGCVFVRHQLCKKDGTVVKEFEGGKITSFTKEETDYAWKNFNGVSGRKLYKCETEVTVEKPELWDIDNPALYLLKTELVMEESSKITLLDSYEQKIGFRIFNFDKNQGFFLNGRHLKLNGACQHHDLGGLGAAFNVQALRRQFMKLLEMGVNSVRCSHNPPSKAFMDLADEMGILIDDESFDMWQLNKTTYDYANYFESDSEKDTVTWVRKDRNHPSLIMWSIGNEIYDCHVGKGLAVTKKLAEYVRKNDPDSNGLVTFASNFMMGEGAQECAQKIEVVGYNYLERLYNEHHKKYPEWKIYGSETGSTIQSRGIYHFPLSMSLVTHDDRQCSSLGNCTTTWGCESTDKVITNDRDAPFSAGQYIWTGWDYIGEPTPYNNTSKSSYFGQICTAGFPKDTFYMYKAEWAYKKTKPFVHILPYWDWNEGQEIEVKVYSNLDFVELVLNERSLGKQPIDHEDGAMLSGVWKVKYEKGELKALGYTEKGELKATEVLNSFGDPVRVKIEAEDIPYVDDGTGREVLHFIDVMTTDKNGYDVSNARNYVTIKVEGDAELVSLDNGDATDFEQYVPEGKKSVHARKLFSNRMCAIVRSPKPDSVFSVYAVSEGLEGDALEFGKGKTVHGKVPKGIEPLTREVPVRKIEIVLDGEITLTKEKPVLKAKAKVLPENATNKKIAWNPMLPESVLSDSVEIEVSKDTAEGELKAVSDGKFILRCTANNGQDYPEIISELNMSVEGVGNPKFNPYKLVEACRLTGWSGNEKPKNGFTGGISNRGLGDMWISFDKVDFGAEGSDEINIPVFCFNDSFRFEVWDGTPEKGQCLLDTSFEAHYQYNTYTEKAFTLNRRLFGVHTISIFFHLELVCHGFRFTQSAKAYGKLRALDADTIVGDTFTKTSQAVEGIGNNVNLDFKGMDFAEGTSRLTVCGKSNKPNNTINLKFFNADGTQSTQVIEFPHSEDYEERSFQIEKVTGLNRVSFVFLPGCDFDFKWFRFEK